MKRLLFIASLFIFFLFVNLSHVSAQGGAQSAACIDQNRGLVFYVGAVQQINGQWMKCTLGASGNSSSWQATTETTASGQGQTLTDFYSGFRAGSYVDGADYPTGTYNARTNNELNGSAYFKFGLDSNILGLADNIAGCIRGKTCPANAPTAYIEESQRRSALGNISQGLAFMYENKPASTGVFLADLGQTLGFLPHQAYAQGIGFSGMAPLLPLWKGMRNLAYALMAVVMIIIAFMVMLRRKIDPKTVVTVQNALPRIIVTLLLITFSYAIVGLVIDFMYLVITLGLAVITQTIPGGQEISLFGIKADLVNGGFFDLLWAVFAPIVNNVGTTGDIANAFKVFQGGDLGQGALNAMKAILGVGAGLVTGGQATILGNLPLLLLLIGYLVVFLRILFVLLMAYIQIILALITGPIQILFDAIPGNEGFSSWLKNLISNVTPFPITIFMLIIGNAIANQALGGGPLWQPPFLPQTGGGVGGFAVTLIWLGIVGSIPSAANAVKDALKAKPPIPGGIGSVITPFTTGGGMIATATAHWWAPQAIQKGSSIFERTRSAGERGPGASMGGGKPSH